MIVQQVAFPDHYTDPKQKDEKWILQFAKAVWSNWNSSMPEGSIFYAKALKYAEIRDYAMNRQNISKYKKQLLSDDSQDESWVKIDWSPRADGMMIRNIAVAKLQKAGYNILATPINAMAKDAEDDAYAELKAKIMLRESLMEKDPELANDPSLKKLPGEPEDIEELKMQIEFSPKLVRAKDIEECAQLVFYENDADAILDSIAEDLVDFGAGICKEYLDENNKVCIRKVNPDSFGCSFTRKPTFDDITWAFEIIKVKLSDLSKTFSEEQIQMLKSKVEGRDGNPTTMGINSLNENGLDVFKSDVMDLEFISWNTRTTEENKDKNGNLRVSKADPKKAKKNPGKYKSKTIEVVYKCKWVVGTDLLYDFGIAENQKRTVEIKTMSKTKLSYHIAAASFDNMRSAGMTEQMMGIIDDLNLATYKLRNFRNRMIPNGFDIDLAAIENVALGATGQGSMKPADVIDMFFETGILISRRSGISMDSNVNYKAINAIQNGMGDQLVAMANDIGMSKQALRDITGLNELTDGSTPNAKTLTTVANLANESTNNALYYLINAKRKLIESTARGVVQRLQIAVKFGPYDGYNKETGRHISIPKSIANYDYDIMIENRPSDEQKQMIYTLMMEDIKAGYISHSEVINIIYTNNLKHAAMLLSYKVEKGKKRQQESANRNIQVTAEEQRKSNMAAEAMKDQMKAKDHQRLLEKIGYEKAWDYMIQKAKNDVKSAEVETKATTEILKNGIADPAAAMPGMEQGPPMDNEQMM